MPQRLAARQCYLMLRFCDGVAVWRTNRKNRADGRAATEFACSFDTAAMQLDNMLYDRQTQTCATQLATPRFVRPIKALEDSRQIARRNSDALIRNAESYGFVLSRVAAR